MWDPGEEEEEPDGKEGREVMWPPDERVTLLPGSIPLCGVGASAWSTKELERWRGRGGRPEDGTRGLIRFMYVPEGGIPPATRGVLLEYVEGTIILPDPTPPPDCICVAEVSED